MARAGVIGLRIVLVLAGTFTLYAGINKAFGGILTLGWQGERRVACVLIFLGGLARLSQMQVEITFGPDLLGSMIAELVGMPLLYLWVSKAVPAEARA